MSDLIVNNKGRGAQSNPPNRFEKNRESQEPEFLEYCHNEGEEANSNRTRFHLSDPKSVVNEVKSPDIGMSYSMNPYQGCEHGCVYCYARNSHEYWGYNAGTDFEKNILIKQRSAELLEKKLRSRSWEGETIVLSGNTDCYQPAEKKYKLTRKCLEVFLKYHHPVGIITKNSLILRDLDLLKQLQERNLIRVYISVTTLDEDTRRKLEPRTATIKKRLHTIAVLSEAGIPVTAMIAPVIPGLNSHEIMALAKAVKEAGATDIAYTVVRLNGAIAGIFKTWIEQTLPDRAARILSLIAQCHGGQLSDSRFGVRTRGEGPVADQIRQLIKIARQKYFPHPEKLPLNKALYPERKAHHTRNEGDQLSLFA